VYQGLWELLEHLVGQGSLVMLDLLEQQGPVEHLVIRDLSDCLELMAIRASQVFPDSLEHLEAMATPGHQEQLVKLVSKVQLEPVVRQARLDQTEILVRLDCQVRQVFLECPALPVHLDLKVTKAM